MISADEEALICDIAETYHVFDYRQLPLKTVAILAAGLRENSRIKIKMAGLSVPLETMLLAHVADGVDMLMWSRTEDGKKNRNRPQSILQLITKENKENPVKGFHTAEDFEIERARIMRGE